MKLTNKKLKKIILEEVGKYLTEVGEGVDPYEWKFIRNVVNDNPPSIWATAEFSSEQNDYEVTIGAGGGSFDRTRKNYLHIEFYTRGGFKTSETNEGVLYKVMSTVFGIVSEHLEDHENFIKENFDGYLFKPAKKGMFSKMGSGSQTVRGRLYTKYIEKHFPSASIIDTGGPDVLVEF